MEAKAYQQRKQLPVTASAAANDTRSPQVLLLDWFISKTQALLY